jgi:hypothetical protein
MCGHTLLGWVLIQLPESLGAPDEPAVQNLNRPLRRLKTFILPEPHLACDLNLCGRQEMRKRGLAEGVNGNAARKRLSLSLFLSVRLCMYVCMYVCMCLFLFVCALPVRACSSSMCALLTSSAAQERPLLGSSGEGHGHLPRRGLVAVPVEHLGTFVWMSSGRI